MTTRAKQHLGENKCLCYHLIARSKYTEVCYINDKVACDWWLKCNIMKELVVYAA